MRKNNLNKLKNGSAESAAEGTSSDRSAALATSGKNSIKDPLRVKNPELDALLEDSLNLRVHGALQKAVKLLNSALRRFPTEPAVFWLLGSIYMHDLDQPEKALPLFRKAIRLLPRSTRASVGLFHSLWDLEREREALRELNRFQSIAHCDDYDEILAEIREKAPELLTKPPKSKAS